MHWFCLALAESEEYNFGAKILVKNELRKGDLQKKAKLTVSGCFTD